MEKPTVGSVAEAVRASISAGDLVPGQRLIEAELITRYSASRGIVRAALIELSHQGSVERIANHGARVRTVTTEEAVEITEVRMALESLCAAKAAERITDQEIVELREIGRKMREAVSSGDLVGYSQLNQHLHVRIREIGGQTVAADILTNLQAPNVRHQFRLALRPGRPQVSILEHTAIIDEVCARRPEAAGLAAHRHLASVIEALKQSD